MPDGPILISPDRSATSFYREVIIKKPHLFKIKCLKEIKDYFQKIMSHFMQDSATEIRTIYHTRHYL